MQIATQHRHFSSLTIFQKQVLKSDRSLNEKLSSNALAEKKNIENPECKIGHFFMIFCRAIFYYELGN